MIYIWLDESDKKGEFYSNFYGGLLINSNDYTDIINEAQSLVDSLNLNGEEIKWQKVNGFTFEKYKKIVDLIFQLLSSGKAKIRIFFKHNQYEALSLGEIHKRDEFFILYYEFIKHAFGLQYCDYPIDERYIRLFFDDIPARGERINDFKRYLLGLNDIKEFKTNGLKIRQNDILEVNSSEHLLLQFLDLILGAMCFRLNNKHKVKQEDTGKRGKRTIIKEKFYKYIYSKISELKPRFNPGESTGLIDFSDRWTQTYRHWSFKPNNYVRDNSKCKITKMLRNPTQ